MAGTLGLGFATASTAAFTSVPINRIRNSPNFRTKIRCIGWNPEGILGPPTRGVPHAWPAVSSRDADAREHFQRQLQEENECRRALRESQSVPDTVEELVEYFLDTEAQELEFEIARMRPRVPKCNIVGT
ncbi:hypothetical protein R6Q59_003847 [Mikania micrantha]